MLRPRPLGVECITHSLTYYGCGLPSRLRLVFRWMSVLFTLIARFQRFQRIQRFQHCGVAPNCRCYRQPPTAPAQPRTADWEIHVDAHVHVHKILMNVQGAPRFSTTSYLYMFMWDHEREYQDEQHEEERHVERAAPLRTSISMSWRHAERARGEVSRSEYRIV